MWQACFSPDGRFVLSGSSDDVAYVWDAVQPAAAPIGLRGHRGEVTCIAWRLDDFGTLLSGSDDGTVRVWSIQRGAAAARQREEGSGAGAGAGAGASASAAAATAAAAAAANVSTNPVWSFAASDVAAAACTGTRNAEAADAVRSPVGGSPVAINFGSSQSPLQTAALPAGSSDPSTGMSSQDPARPPPAQTPVHTR